MAAMQASRSKSGSATPIPSTETNIATDPRGSSVTEEEWKAMQTVLNNIYAYREAEDYDPSKAFHRKVNKRVLPAYYEVIKEPVALSTIKAKINGREYHTFSQFVRDFALRLQIMEVIHNAQVYNRPDAGVYQDALTIKGVLEAELQNLVDQKIISEDVAKLPFLGEIPPPDENPPEEEEEEEEEEDEDDEDDEGDESEDDGGRRKRKRGPRSTAAILKREGTGRDDARKDDPELRKKRGRPPRVDTPMEARIKAIMKGLRKPKNTNNQLKINHFERLPDRNTMPEYYNEIKSPIALDLIKKRLKRKKYQSVEQFMRDIEQMFENAKLYNEDDSQIYKDAVDLQREARSLAEQEKKKPDTDYLMEDGRLPLPEGILHNGTLWKVGDWVHIQNPNDLTKPIVAQIYRTWQDTEGQKWVNACWYYRPEQTVHRFDRHFFENEVVKTGQYRDHHIDEVVDKCFVMFFTRYNKGRPRGFPPDKEVYVCEARYNEEKHKLNKIKTWASCLPDEVRERDYEMDLFNIPRKMKKVPSPIAYLLKEDAKETDDLPKPVWGAENAPPKIGAVHRRPRDPKESPPPEPTPTPPPDLPAPNPPRQVPNSAHQMTSAYVREQRADYNSTNGASSVARTVASPPQTLHHPSGFSPQQAQRHLQTSMSPVPPAQPMHTPKPLNFAPPVVPPNFSAQQSMAHINHYSPSPSVYPQPGNRPAASSYNAPPANEVYYLPESANSSIPQDIREQFQRDANGRVLFFTTPPLDPLQPHAQGDALGRSARYLAAKARREELLERKRKLDEAEAPSRLEAQKRAAHEAMEDMSRKIRDLTSKALTKLEQDMLTTLEADYRRLYPEDWKLGMESELSRLQDMQITTDAQRRHMEEHATKQDKMKTVPLRGGGFF